MITDLGRVTTAYASGYQRWRVHQADLYPGEVRSLVGVFNGAMPVGDTIASAKWNTWNSAVAVLSTAAYSTDKRSVSIDLSAGFSGQAIVRLRVTTAQGGRYVVNYRINVLAAPVYEGDVYVTGPTVVSLVVP